jgi:hypothetical protein
MIKTYAMRSLLLDEASLPRDEASLPRERGEFGASPPPAYAGGSLSDDGRIWASWNA